MKNKERYAQWAALGSSVTSEKPEWAASRRIFDLPQIRRLEDTIRLSLYNRDEATKHKIDDIAALICNELFGITPEDTEFGFPEHYWGLPADSFEKEQIEWQADDHDDTYETLQMTDDEVVEFFRGFGLDFRNDEGQPLLCTKTICRVVESVVKGRKGRLPDWQEVDAQSWGDSLERDAKAWTKNR